MRDWWKLVFGLICGLLGAGLILLLSKSPRGESITLLPPPTPAPIIVHVAGAVANPGVYTLPANSRVQDAIQAAGGLLSDAETQTINLAAFLQDGGRLLIPSRESTPLSRGVPVSPVSTLSNSGIVYPLNINTSTQAELESLPDIGPITAQNIIEYREAHGPFSSIEEIMDVPGIGPKTFDRIKDLITVET